MSPHFEKYCNECKKFGYAPTMNEKELHLAWGIKDEEIHVPFVARKSSIHKNIKPTLKAHIETTKKTKEESIPQIKNIDLIKVLDDLIKKPRKSRSIRLNPIQKTSLKDMSDDEKRKHKNEVKKKSYAKRKELGILHIQTAEQIETARAYSKEYYHQNKEVQTQKRKDYRASLSDEKKQALKAKMSEWQKNNRELVNQRAREWKKQRKEKLKNAS